MQYRTLGRTGERVSEIGFGAWAIGGGWGSQNEQDSIAALHRALDLGVNFIDTAAGYGSGRSERIIAQVLADRSEDVLVATKQHPAPGQWPPSPYDDVEERFSEAYLRKTIEERLTNLNTDCIDILQLHTWTRAWNDQPKALDTLKTLQSEGKVRYIGVSTPEHDQNSVIELMKAGYLDVVQVIYNIFEQEPAAELLPVAEKHGVGIIVRVALDEGVLTGKYDVNHQFPEGDFRRNYLAGDRLERSVRRVEAIRKDIEGSGLSMVEAALKFVLAHPAVSTIITGIRNPTQAEANVAVSDTPPMSAELVETLRGHAWRKGFWYSGK